MYLHCMATFRTVFYFLLKIGESGGNRTERTGKTVQTSVQIRADFCTECIFKPK